MTKIRKISTGLHSLNFSLRPTRISIAVNSFLSLISLSLFLSFAVIFLVFFLSLLFSLSSVIQVNGSLMMLPALPRIQLLSNFGNLLTVFVCSIGIISQFQIPIFLKYLYVKQLLYHIRDFEIFLITEF